MAQLVAFPIMARLNGVDMDQHEMKHVDVQIQSSPVKFYNVFRKEANRLPQMSPNYVKSITVVHGNWNKVDSEKMVVYYPEGEDVSSGTERFKDKLVRANESAKSVTFQVLEGEIMENYRSFFAELQVTNLNQSNWARWTVVYEKKSTGSPEPDQYLELLKTISKDVDDFLRNN